MPYVGKLASWRVFRSMHVHNVLTSFGNTASSHNGVSHPTGQPFHACTCMGGLVAEYMTCVSPNPAGTFGPTEPIGSLEFGSFSRWRWWRQSLTTMNPLSVIGGPSCHRFTRHVHYWHNAGMRGTKPIRDRAAYNNVPFREYKAWLRSTFVYCSVCDD